MENNSNEFELKFNKPKFSVAEAHAEHEWERGFIPLLKNMDAGTFQFVVRWRHSIRTVDLDNAVQDELNLRLLEALEKFNANK